MNRRFITIIFMCFIVALSLITMICIFSPEQSFALRIGETELQGYEPEDLVTTDKTFVDPEMAATELPSRLESLIVKFVKLIMPIVALVCVAMIIFNAVANIFRKKENRVPFGEMIKNIVVNMFFIMFAFVIVEWIIYFVSGGETLLVSLLTT